MRWHRALRPCTCGSARGGSGCRARAAVVRKLARPHNQPTRRRRSPATPPPLFVSTPNDSPLLDFPPAGAEPIAAGNLGGLGRRQPSPDGPCVPSHVSRGAVRCGGAPRPSPNCLPALLSSSSCWSSLTAALLRILWPPPVIPVLGTLASSPGATGGVRTRSQSTAAACGGRRRGASASIGPSRTHTAVLGLSQRGPLTRRAPSWCLTSSLLAL